MNFIGIDSELGIRKVDVERKVSATKAAVLFLLDESGSMAGDSIKNLNDAINRFPNDVCANNRFAQTNIELAVMAFTDKTRLVADWKPLENYTPVSLDACGGTNLSVALGDALKKVNNKLASGSCDIAHVVLISDGCGGDVTNVANEIARMKSEGKLIFWMLAVSGFDSKTAQKLTGGERLYRLENGKHFDYTDFINVLASAVVKMQNGSQTPKLKKIPGIKGIGSKSGGGNSSGSPLGGGKFGGGKFGF